MKRASRNIATLVTVLFMVLIAACTTPPPPTIEWGMIEIGVTDPPPADVTSAEVTAKNIEVHKVSGEEGEWIMIIEGPITFDLVTLAEQEEAEILGAGEIETGSFTGIRMDVVEVVVTIDGYPDSISATVPSDKLKIVRPFNVEGGVKTILTIDFDGSKSLILPGKDIVTGKERALFKPVVKLLIDREKLED